MSPSAVKASAGAVEHLLLAPVDDLPGALADLHVRGLRIVGADADAALTVREADLRGPLALVVGSEGQGLGPAVRRRCDLLVRIPMRGAVGSLNASVAGSILLYEATTQRVGSAAAVPDGGPVPESASDTPLGDLAVDGEPTDAGTGCRCAAGAAGEPTAEGADGDEVLGTEGRVEEGGSPHGRRDRAASAAEVPPATEDSVPVRGGADKAKVKGTKAKVRSTTKPTAAERTAAKATPAKAERAKAERTAAKAERTATKAASAKGTASTGKGSTSRSRAKKASAKDRDPDALLPGGPTSDG